MLIKHATQSDVARVAGTSTAVVSYVVNGGPRPVAKETRKRVLDAIRKTGYRPNTLARALLTGKTSTLGVVVSDLGNPFLSGMVQCLEDEFFTRGYSLFVADSHDDPWREKQIAEMMLSRHVAGLVRYSVDQPPTADLVRDMRGPVVFLNACEPIGGAGHEGRRISVLENERTGTAGLTEELIRRGCRRIGHLGGPQGRINSAERARGWYEALREKSGLDESVFAGREGDTPESSPLYISAPYTHEGGWNAADKFVDLGCDGIVASNEMQAVGILARFNRLGLRIPADISVVALHTTNYAPYTTPALSGMHVDLDGLAHSIADAVFEQKDCSPIIPNAYFSARESCAELRDECR